MEHVSSLNVEPSVKYRNAQYLVRLVATPVSETDYHTVPNQTVSAGPDGSVCMVRAVLQPEFISGVQVYEPKKANAPIQLQVFPENSTDESEIQNIATAANDEVTVLCSRFGLEERDGELYRTIRLDNPDLPGPELAAIDQVGELLLTCAGY